MPPSTVERVAASYHSDFRASGKSRTNSFKQKIKMAAPMNENSGGDQASDDASIIPSVNFLYKTMLQRDPRKRRVKPVADNLVQISFGGLDDDSEEDSDFDIGRYGKHDSGDSVVEDEDSDGSYHAGIDEVEHPNSVGNSLKTSDKGKSSGAKNTDSLGEESCSTSESEDDDMKESSEDNSDEEFDDVEEEDEHDDDASSEASEESSQCKDLAQALNSIESDEDDEDYVPKKKKKKPGNENTKPSTVVQKKSKKIKAKKKLGKASECEKAPCEGLPTESHAAVEAAPQTRIKVIVCCVCLSDRSAADDEIVECDNCGISVHEGCYGISESHSAASTESSASTEPWFCDACKASANPVCELCPNSGGIFKETDNGKWVHIVCALYTPGVAFGDVDRLSLVTLFEMPYSKWGAKECSLCEDSRFSQTGVCINCDAGMCKAYFHVTCAQRHGLLAEVTPEDAMEVADPFFAYCKLHADKMASKMKRRNWLAIQSHVKTHKPSIIDDSAEKLRFQRKLKHHIEKYSIAKSKKPPAWVPDQKMVRHLHTSPVAVQGFLKKAELMGIITQTQTVPVESQEQRKKAQGQPAFTPDFITYFMERNAKLENLKTSATELSSQNQVLQAEEKKVRKKYDKLASDVKGLQQRGATLRKDGESLCGILQEIYGKPLSNIPDVFKLRKRVRSPSKKETSTPDSVIIHQCGICHKTQQQHLLAKCDSCKEHFHLGCLNPPLTRMPKKTKLFGWQCSSCALSSSDGSVKSAPDPYQPRKLRETIREPDKFFHLSHIQDSLDSQRRKSDLNKKSRQRRKTAQGRIASQKKKGQKSSPGGKKSPTKTTPTKLVEQISGLSPKKTAEIKSFTTQSTDGSNVADGLTTPDIMCVVCNGGATVMDTVRCDECMLYYHLACLDPPMKKSPKVRGYIWQCEACGMQDSSDEEDKDPGSSTASQSRSQQKTNKACIMLGSGREGREASTKIMFDVDDSSDDQTR